MRASFAFLIVLIGTTVFAQPEPTLESVRLLGEKYRAERDVAVKESATAESLAAMDALAAKADAAILAMNPKAAERFFREARWQLPARPLGLPPHVERVIGYVRLRHADRVNSISYNSDGTRLASASKDGTVRIWDLGNGRELLAYRDHAEIVSPEVKVNDSAIFRVPAVAFAPKSTRIASTGGNEIHLWDSTTGKLVKKYTGHTMTIKGLAFAPDGKTFATGSDDKTVRIWSVETGKEIIAFPLHTSRVESVAFSPNGKLVAATDGDGFLSIYKLDATDKKPVLKVQAAEPTGQGINAVAFTPDGTKVVTGGNDAVPRLTTSTDPLGAMIPGSGVAIMKFPGHSGRVNSVAINADGTLIATAGSDKTIRIWDAKNGKALRAIQGHLDEIATLAIRPDGKQIASGSTDGTIRLWDLSATDEHRAATDTKDSLWTAAFSPDGTRYATAGADKTLRVYSTATGLLEHSLTGHSGAITTVVFPSSDRIASASGDKLIKIWDAKDGRAIRSLAGHTSAVLALGVVDGGRLVSGSADKTVKMWDATADKPVWSWASKSAVSAVATRAGGKQIVVGSADGWLAVLDTSSGEPKAISGLSAHNAGVAAIAVSPDGSRIATVGGDGHWKLWAIAETGILTSTGKEEISKKTTTLPALSTVAFRLDGKQIAFGGADGIVHIADTGTGVVTRGLRGHTDWITAISFAANGEQLLSVGVDKVCRVFELGKASAIGSGHAMAIRSIAVSRDGTRIATGSDDRTVKVWNPNTGKEVATLTGSTSNTNSVAFIGMDRVAAGGEDSRLRIWSIDPVKDLRSSNYGKIYNIIASSDGSKLGIWSRNGADLDAFDILTVDGAVNPEVIQEKKPKEATSATFASDVSLAVYGMENGSIRIWDMVKRERVGADWPLFVKRVGDVGITADKKTLVAVDEEGLVKVATLADRAVTHSTKTIASGINGLVVSPNGEAFAVIGTEGTIKAYDMAAKELRSWTLPGATNAAAFSPDGKRLYAANADGTITVLALPTGTTRTPAASEPANPKPSR